MKIRDMFAKDIDRQINGVVKAEQDDEASIRQELEEYVVTRELRKHFAKFYGAYERALDAPTDNVGVWVSGFFGSGKSHFLKILSYALSNRALDGRPAVEYLAPKFDDPMLAAQARRCASVATESILFNIDAKGPSPKTSTAILQTFARVFYDHQGFYGQDLNLVRLEQHVEECGKTAPFRAAYERLAGKPWVDDRKTWKFKRGKVIDALVEVGAMDRADAEAALSGPGGAPLSIDSLVEEVKAYVDAKAAQNGGDFRLLFMVDEVGQYIADDTSLMLNLQTIVEKLGERCAGRVWVMVTSQEAIDEITRDMAGNDFSKIRGRFATSLSLSSSSVDEVIQKRLLAKTPQAEAALKADYAELGPTLRNLFTFRDARTDLVGYTDEASFVASFPFASYQFRLMPEVFKQVRMHGSSGKHLSSGERSMLSGFQEAAQAVEGGDAHTLVPFWRFYDTMASFLETYIQGVVIRCDEAAQAGDQGLEPYDVRVLKLLFLVRYVDEMPATVDNVAILMADDARCDIVRLRSEVQASLDRLVRQKYVARTGEVYTFMTNEEQDIAREIERESVSAAEVVAEISKALFDDVLADTAKLRYDQGDFEVDRWVDETRHGAARNGMVLRVVTCASSLAGEGEQALALRSAAPEAVVVLGGAGDYYDLLLRARQIDRYAKSRNLSQLPESTRAIIKARQDERVALVAQAREDLVRALEQARFYVAGDAVEPKSGSASQKVRFALERLTDATYEKRSYIAQHVADDAALRAILAGQGPRTLDGQDPNQRAVNDVLQFLELTAGRPGASYTAADLQARYRGQHYGWRELDVAGVLAALVAQQRVTVRRAGAAVAPGDPRLPGYLYGRDAEKTTVLLRAKPSDAALRAARSLLSDLKDVQDVPSDEDGLVREARGYLAACRDELQNLLAVQYARGAYPGRDLVERARQRYTALLGSADESAPFLDAFTRAEDELLGLKEDLAVVLEFFHGGQRERFDDAARFRASVEQDRSYLEGDAAAVEALEAMDQVLRGAEPYGRITALAGLQKTVAKARDALLDAKRRELLDGIAARERELDDYAHGRPGTEAVLTRAKQALLAQRDRANAPDATLTGLDALAVRLNSLCADLNQQIDDAAQAAGRTRPTHPDTDPRTTRVPPAPKPDDIPQVRVVPLLKCGRALRSEREVDAYAAELAAKLKQALRGHDGIRIVQ